MSELPDETTLDNGCIIVLVVILWIIYFFGFTKAFWLFLALTVVFLVLIVFEDILDAIWTFLFRDINVLEMLVLSLIVVVAALKIAS